jgi:hypothetical protein
LRAIPLCQFLDERLLDARSETGSKSLGVHKLNVLPFTFSGLTGSVRSTCCAKIVSDRRITSLSE